MLAFTFLTILQLKINNSRRTYGDSFIKYVKEIQSLYHYPVTLLLLVGYKQNRKHLEKYQNKWQ